MVRALSKTNRDVLVIDKTKSSENNTGIFRYLQGDYGDSYFLGKALSGIDEVILLAHSTTPKTSFDHSMADLMSNVPAAVDFFETASRLQLKKIIFLSSGGTVYGRASQLPVTEDHPTNPISPYGITKLTIEKYGYMYHILKNMPFVAVRPGNAFGEGQRAFSGQGFIATVMGSILEGRRIQMYGDRGTIRDYIYIDDLVSGIIRVLDKGIPGECYNVGTGQGRDNIDVINEIDKIIENTGYHTAIDTLLARPFDVPANVLDFRKLNRLTGWKPRVTFEDGLARMWNCFVRQYKDNL